MTRQPRLIDDGSDLPLFAGAPYGPPEPEPWQQVAHAVEQQPTIGLCVRCFAPVEDTEVLCEVCQHECKIEDDYERNGGNW